MVCSMGILESMAPTLLNESKAALLRAKDRVDDFKNAIGLL